MIFRHVFGGQSWTITFVVLLAVAFGVAARHKREDAKRREQRKTAHGKRDETEE